MHARELSESEERVSLMVLNTGVGLMVVIQMSDFDRLLTL